MEAQTRSESGEIKFFNSLHHALLHGMKDKTVWKISFNADGGERIRLIRTPIGWVYEDVMTGDRMIYSKGVN